MFKHNLTPVLNKQRPDKKGQYPLRIRSIIKNRTSYYPTGIMLFENQWDKAKGKIILHPNNILLNATLTTEVAKIETAFITQSLAGSETLKIEKKVTKDFIKYVEEKIQKNKPLRKASTTIQLSSALSKFKGFKSKLSFNEINANLLHEYEAYCRELGNTDNTVWSSIKFVKTFVHEALYEGVIKTDPILNFKGTKYKDPKPSYLTADELKKIESVATNINVAPQYRNAANWFLFSCYTGLRFGDALKFTKEKIVNERIVLRTEKTGSDVSIALHPKLKKVIKRLDTILTTNQDYNRNLKAVAAIAKINKPITSHLARHTNGVLFLNKGGSMEVLREILGHASIKTTQIYGKIINTRIDDEVKKAWG